ncbi:hypothetical protein ACIHFE_24385 [Streptomyces sp. NPDC052396]|uniref:hypothetical protein n=1 Tax=Streptomyces sp. NPDC052396 TaxID=3365689 RepID=UPI0037D1BE8A
MDERGVGERGVDGRGVGCPRVDYGLFEQAAGGRCGTEALVRAGTAALEEIAAGRRELCAVRHPLGFLCLPVERDEDQGVCVHVFGGPQSGEAAAPLTTSPVHAHSWDLVSCVLYGRVVNVQMSVADRRDAPTHRVFEVVSHPSGVDELRPTRRLVTCRPGAARTSGAGEIYTHPAGEFHTTVLPDDGAATLLLGRTRPGGRDLSLGPLDGTGHRVVRQHCDFAQSARTAGAVLRRLHAPQRR